MRPRVSTLLTPFDTVDGKRYVWTTFSPDQIDLNFKNYQVLVRVAEILLYYVRRGADLIPLDAVTYLWAELGASCAHLAETHALVQLFRAILDVVAPHVALVTESNVPHRDNISYFGDGGDEAQVVYNFALPRLVLLSFQKADCTVLSQWAATSEKVSDTCTYFNFLDSHDGVGLLAVKDLLSEEQVNDMIQTALEHGGVVSYKDNPDGMVSPYEIDITWYSALNKENDGESLDLKVSRFVASRAIALALRGVPGVYLPGLFGARNDLETVLDSGEPRRINRKNIDEEALLRRLGEPTVRRSVRGRKWYHEVVTERCPRFHRQDRLTMKLENTKPFILCMIVLGVSGLHFATGTAGSSLLVWHVFFRKLYFVPIVIGAVWFGVTGALITAGSVIVLYGVHVWLDWSLVQLERIDQVGEMMSFVVLAAVSGVLVTLERLARQKAERIRRNAEREKVGTAVATLAETLGARDTSTLMHSRRVAKLAEGFGIYLSLPRPVVRSLYLAGILHDIGKIGIRDDVLLKPESLDPEERRKIMEHPRIAEKILAPIGFDKVVRYVATHHESVDGTGYPEGLKGEEIPLPGRILAIADTYDALSSARPYKAPLSNGRVRKIMNELSGERLDADLLEKFWDYLAAREARR